MKLTKLVCFGNKKGLSNAGLCLWLIMGMTFMGHSLNTRDRALTKFNKSVPDD